MLAVSEKCTGCGACANVCPKQCIEMKYDEDGFLQPVINSEQCNKCGLCERTCPIINEFHRNNNESPDAYACWNKDKAVLADSTSGGAFSAIAEDVINNGGVVFASKMDTNLKVSFTKIEHVEDLQLVRGSKYIQSEPGSVYYEIKNILKTGKKALFIGCPCQVAGLYAYLDKVYTEELITVDLVCHGVGSTDFFRQYVEENEKKSKLKMINFIARDKKRGWDNLTVKHVYADGSKKYIKSTSNVFMKAYYSGLIYRDSCYKCPFSNIPRIGDITIGDYFGIDKNAVSKESFLNGISLVLINNGKGEIMFKNTQQKINFTKRELKEATATNSCLIHPMPWHKQHDEFFKQRAGMTMKQIDKKYCQYGWKTKVSLLLGKRMTKVIQSITHRLKTIKK